MAAALRSADPVIVRSGRTVYVVNIVRNRFRLIMAVHFDKQRLFVLRVLTHAEYDLDKWKKEL